LKSIRWLLPIFLAIILSLIFTSAVVALPEIETWESYTSGDDSSQNVTGAEWIAQTFTIDPESHSITGIQVRLYRVGSPGTITASIRETTGGTPVGSDLTSGTVDGDTITTALAGGWYSIDFTEYRLDYGEIYAIVVRAEAGDDTNYVVARYDSTGAYADGLMLTSTDGGMAWTPSASSDMMFEVKGKALLDINDGKVFSGYREANDLLFVATYFNTYTPYYPTGEPANYFWIQLRSADGGTVLAQTVCRAWGYKPCSVYLSAEEVAKLTVGTQYRFYIYGNIAETPSYYYTFEWADWLGSDLTMLDLWVLSAARNLAGYYGTDFTTSVGDNEVLNEEGGVIFALGIPQLQYVRPDIFQTVVHIPEYESIEWTNAFEEYTDWEERMGADAVAAFTATGGIVGLSGRDLLAFVLFVAYLGICLAVMSRREGAMSGDPTVMAILAVPLVLLLGIWLRVIPIALMATIAAVATLITVFRFWFSRT